MKLSKNNDFEHNYQNITEKIKYSFNDLIPKEIYKELMLSCSRIRLFDPITTLWAFIVQVLSTDQSCRSAVANIMSFKSAHNLKVGSLNTSAYCRAREKLSTEIIKKATKLVGYSSMNFVKNEWKWKNRNVKILDGTTVKLADTKENQEKFPQISRQKLGLGFPIIRILAAFDYTTGSLLAIKTGSYSGKGQAEPSLLRKILDLFSSSDIFLLDRFFTAPSLLHEFNKRGIDFIIRYRDKKAEKIRKAHNVKTNGSIVTIKDFKKEFNIKVRLIKRKIDRKGFRVKDIYIITSLLNTNSYTDEEIVNLYAKRWEIEINFRNIKDTMNLKFIHAKTPIMVEKHIWVTLLAYNLIRKIMVDAGLVYKLSPRELSFKTALQVFGAYKNFLCIDNYMEMLRLISTSFKCGRPKKNNYEPRATKRRKRYNVLTKPREEARSTKWGYHHQRSSA